MVPAAGPNNRYTARTAVRLGVLICKMGPCRQPTREARCEAQITEGTHGDLSGAGKHHECPLRAMILMLPAVTAGAAREFSGPALLPVYRFVAHSVPVL